MAEVHGRGDPPTAAGSGRHPSGVGLPAAGLAARRRLGDVRQPRPDAPPGVEALRRVAGPRPRASVPVGVAGAAQGVEPAVPGHHGRAAARRGHRRLGLPGPPHGVEALHGAQHARRPRALAPHEVEPPIEGARREASAGRRRRRQPPPRPGLRLQAPGQHRRLAAPGRGDVAVRDHVDAARHRHGLHVVAVDAADADVDESFNLGELPRLHVDGDNTEHALRLRVVQGEPIDHVPHHQRLHGSCEEPAVVGLLGGPVQELLARLRPRIDPPDASAALAASIRYAWPLQAATPQLQQVSDCPTGSAGSACQDPRTSSKHCSSPPPVTATEPVPAGQQGPGAAPGGLPRRTEEAPAARLQVELQDGGVRAPDEEPARQPGLHVPKEGGEGVQRGGRRRQEAQRPAAMSTATHASRWTQATNREWSL
eukprot:CAMPEP_0175371564 /NCGR_PEP_ID=MMETSP0095-20121207/21784_1 /TAXON_ID=311494 /ORGANISM="Alexandrium monilatum, Strain CCMP3105" /LENGTH=424 /DNA_ID=CAMNT_0016669739 /DNA_START=1 /DNA_END=1272 /DNA_ORIENTATION=-